MKSLIYALLITNLISTSFAASGDKAKKVVKEESKALVDAQKSQKRVNKLSDETQELLRQYRQTTQQIENAKIYNDQLRKIIATQEQEKISIAEQIEEITDTSKKVVPMMVEKVQNFEQIVNLDIPFLPEERAKRVSDLKATLNRADVSNSEKFRHILEAYQIENDYGRTIEAYRGIRKADGAEKTVDYLRIGRIAFMYQTLDGKESGLFNNQTRKWEELDGSYRKSIQEAIKMARKQSAPQLVKLPIFAAGDAK
ncbi:MAG: hypothetical protein CME63_05560 [Halobacteriovoraceae bacterium]|nr:hypothetical protein [Halobacteriovoraceae bacterium]MBC97195.1 hypothetical protein [Halobacteriovoraceae bacterium]|tara:strand:- start:88683 stop:89447 length:765 start_codon:yes stop_codon:yes gene_type:complete